MRTRELQIDHTRADDGERTAPCTLSTEHPVNRGDYFEVLAHDSDSVDLSRAPLPLIESHDATRLNIGVVENLAIENRKLRGTVRLGNSNRAKELWPDIKAGIVRNLSIGYSWDDYKTEGDTVRVTRWAPHELSLVAAGADPAAGLYRNMEPDMETEVKTETRSDKRRANKAASQERERILEINELVRVHKTHAPEYERSQTFINALEAEAQAMIEDGGSPDVLQRWMSDNKPRQSRQPPANGFVGHLEADGRSMRDMFNGIQPGNNILQPISQKQLRHFGDNTRDQQANAYRAGMWARATLWGDPIAARWAQDNGVRAMGETTGSLGGHTVPQELSNSIIRLVEDYGAARQLCRIIPMGSDSLQIPRRSSGTTSYYVSEGSEISTSDMAFDQIGLNARKLAVLTRLSSELGEDSVIDLAGLLAEEAAHQFAYQEDQAFVNGDGTSTYGGIYGLLPKIIDGTHTAGAVDAQTGHDTFGEIDNTDLVQLMAALPSYARRGAKWLCSPEAHSLVFHRLAAAAGGATMTETTRGSVPSFLGHEIVVSDAMPSSTGDLSDQGMLAFGNFSQAATMGLRRDISMKVDDSRYLEYDQIAVRAVERFDLVVHELGDNTDAGSVVCLIGE